MRKALVSSCAAVLLAATALPAAAKPARCFTTDDGHFDCEFRAIDKAGSFEITGEGVPAYSLLVEGPGVAYGFVRIDDRSIPLPGEYRRSQEDGACWENADTDTRICAW